MNTKWIKFNYPLTFSIRYRNALMFSSYNTKFYSHGVTSYSPSLNPVVFLQSTCK